MYSLQIARTAARSATVTSAAGCAARRITPARAFGGGHGPPPPTDGIEGMVRKYLPNDEHMALGIMGFYGVAYGLFKLTSGGKKEEEAKVEAAAPSTAAAGDEIPSMADEKFDSWSEIPGNMEKWVASLEKSFA
mmetsp:Transcript_17056/g.24928  ORF Transcript_17056/g.24928 Transcript_17056/m.24928 type:complete len:134 (-) Transcript_17056:138-539(-)|eukprot:CAMPEP_0113935774 /NCGR_PEP_ID=MMETSP1339-20121228/2848_1 /TAXON_ID=94617 /ORGANISM="Fibrocapsa japonica" /LENGTH=133 /DNA_ID=CAMNT_0000938033 /DNA_START=63 /DNA_END=464 /DNA_ORIENTATION=+ /assembly_acc=CAM_ASM_000762